MELRSTVTTLDGVQDPQDYGKTPRQVVGVGSVGRIPGKSTYALFSPENGQLSFRTVNYGKAKGFGTTKQ
jgi:hypothetical protein